MKGSKLIIVSIFLLSQYAAATGQFPCARKPCKNTIPTNFTVYEKTFSIIAEGPATGHFNRTDLFHDFFARAGITSQSEIVAKGREFVANMMTKYGVDVSGLTDTQLYLGETVDLGDFIFLTAVIENSMRVITETTPTQAKYYRNAKGQMAGYRLHPKMSMTLSGGSWEGTISQDSALWVSWMVLETDEDCGFPGGFSTKPEVFTVFQAAPDVIVDGLYPIVSDISS
ncbi:unnamed protein product [Owenia fusiformis]|uniref:Uncharacterized protein n=1 Tax=Owenia fusiformis TaxID=6347 RepID=A0A8J1XG76_OWEFU|nr:unnamed protein product [Owenia fusiformis]